MVSALDWMVSPQTHVSSEHDPIWKYAFTDVVIWGHTGLEWTGVPPVTGVLIRRPLKIVRHNREGWVKVGAESTVMQWQATEHWGWRGPTRSWEEVRKCSSLWTSEGAQLCQCLDCWCLVSRAGVCGTLLWQPQQSHVVGSVSQIGNSRIALNTINFSNESPFLISMVLINQPLISLVIAHSWPSLR